MIKSNIHAVVYFTPSHHEQHPCGSLFHSHDHTSNIHEVVYFTPMITRQHPCGSLFHAHVKQSRRVPSVVHCCKQWRIKTHPAYPNEIMRQEMVSEVLDSHILREHACGSMPANMLHIVRSEIDYSVEVAPVSKGSHTGKLLRTEIHIVQQVFLRLQKSLKPSKPQDNRRAQIFGNYIPRKSSGEGSVQIFNPLSTDEENEELSL
ncbi:hypothetical protein AVEN_267795-1 [Araneus ventricosus]|uniref:Uncharacterized protein n=1 Tax=Araneus ventricosus TaxID=182803 RepID=A0A4Y2REG9_ARAVE|nr:hypothetical protein AVEN_267795-1 [Araneus ventricosus]